MCLIPPCLVSCSALLSDTYTDKEHEINLPVKTWDFLFADDGASNTSSAAGKRESMGKCDNVCGNFGLTDSKIQLCICFTENKSEVKGNQRKDQLKVYHAVGTPILWNAYETWTVHSRHARQLKDSTWLVWAEYFTSGSKTRFQTHNFTHSWRNHRSVGQNMSEEYLMAEYQSSSFMENWLWQTWWIKKTDSKTLWEHPWRVSPLTQTTENNEYCIILFGARTHIKNGTRSYKEARIEEEKSKRELGKSRTTDATYPYMSVTNVSGAFKPRSNQPPLYILQQ